LTTMISPATRPAPDKSAAKHFANNRIVSTLPRHRLPDGRSPNYIRLLHLTHSTPP